MELFICVLADLLHLVKVILLCDMFYVLQKRGNSRYHRLMLLSAVIVIVVSSVIFTVSNHPLIETFAYIIIIFIIINFLYSEKIFQVIIFSLGVVFSLSMIDTMTFILVDIIIELVGIKKAIVFDLIAPLISLIMIYIVGRIYRKNVSTAINNISFQNLIGYNILLAIDTFVVAIVATTPIVELYDKTKRSLYLIAVIFVIVGIFIQLISVIILFTQRNVYKEKEEITDRYLNEQKNHYEYLENREKETKKFRHDLRSHMEMISNLAKNNEYEEVDAYLEQMHIKIDSFGNMVTVQNGIVDAIINQYYMKAMQSGVKMEVKGRFPVDCSIDAFDLCTIFSNVLSNALEAAAETEEKYISLECGYTDKNIIIVVENSFCEDAKSGNFLWTTRKANKDYHGYGLENINDSVNKYDGVFDIEPKGNRFILKILFHNVGK